MTLDQKEYSLKSLPRHLGHVRVYDADLQLGRVRVARSFATRAVGLLRTPSLSPGEGLLIVPCRGVHTLGMRYPLDLIYLDDQGRILLVKANVAPWRLGPTLRRGFAVLELPTGGPQPEVGSRLQFIGTGVDQASSSS